MTNPTLVNLYNKNKLFIFVFLFTLLSPWVFEKDFFKCIINKYFISPIAKNISIYGWITMLIIFILLQIKVIFGSKTLKGIYYLIISIGFPTIVYYLFNEKIYGNNTILNNGSKVILIYFIVIILWERLIFIIMKFEKNRKPSIEKQYKDGFLIENAITSLEEDEFRRKPFILKLKELIENTECEERSFNIAVTGDWGSGKTSLLNILENQFKTKHDDYIVIKYDPWVNHDEKLIPKEFIRTILNSIDSSDELYHWFTRYLELLNEDNTNTWLKSTQTVLQFGQEKRNLQTIKKEITNYLFNENKKLIVIIDDLDRLEASEIMDIIRLIRNSADFGSTFYILGFDYTYVISQINDILKNKAETYLQKIFQVRVDLPNVENAIYLNGIFNTFKTEFDIEISTNKHRTKTGFESDVDQLKHWIIHWEIKNKRDLASIINSAKLMKSCLKKDCILELLINLEIIRYYYPKFYYYIYSILSQINNSNEREVGADQNLPKWSYLLQDYSLDFPDKTKALELFGYLFKDEYFNKKEDFKGSELPKYFVFNILAGQLRKEEFDNIYNMTFSLEEAYRFILSKNGRNDYEQKLMQKLDEHEKVDESTLKYLFKLQLLLLKDFEHVAISFNDGSVDFKLLNLFSKNEIVKDEIVDYLLKNEEFPYIFESQILKALSKVNFISDEFSLTKRFELFNMFLNENSKDEKYEYYRRHFWAMNTYYDNNNVNNTQLKINLQLYAKENPLIILYFFIEQGEWKYTFTYNFLPKYFTECIPEYESLLDFKGYYNDFDKLLIKIYEEWRKNGKKPVKISDEENKLFYEKYFIIQQKEI